ncbi:MAG: prepilin peptidase [Campylobacterota bacterium]|nr:prepilin peptidase [Campylobacterota bacterium]
MEWFFLAVISACVGSFFNVLIHRVPRGEDFVYEPSHCPKCNNRLKPWHNIPIVSWSILKGRCYFCKEKISFRYPLVEFLVMVLSLAVFYKLGFGYEAALVSFVFAFLVVLSAIDIDFHEIPDSINLLALTLAFFTIDFIDSLHGALVVAGTLALLRFYVSYIFKKEAMGEGDIIIGATMGALLGYELGLLALFLTPLLSIPFGLKYKELPFVPFLSFSAFVVYCFDDWFMGFL